MPTESYEDIEARLDRLIDSTEQVLHRMQQVMRGEIPQDPQIMGRTLLESMEMTVESQKTTKGLVEALKARTS